MYGYISGFSFGDEINNCPYCGSDNVSECFQGIVYCRECKKRFGVIEDDEEEEEEQEDEYD